MKQKNTFLKLIKQLLSFLLISGTGWVIDFLGYTILTYIIHIEVMYANMISAIPSITFVFLISTRKIFETSYNRISLKRKYVIYILYQIIIILIISLLGQILYNWFNLRISKDYILLRNYLKILIKLGITPITMLSNFIVMKFLAEKV